jgi:hypothetical protein
MLGKTGRRHRLCRRNPGVRDPSARARSHEQTNRGRQLPGLPDSDARNTCNVGRVLPLWRPDHLDQLSPWLRLADVAAIV